MWRQKLFLITRTTRGTVGLFFAAMSAFFVCVMLFQGASTENMWTEAIGLAILSAAMIWNDIAYLVTPADKHWQKWENCHASDEQRARMRQVINEDLTVKRIDKATRSGSFVGKQRGLYCTTLASCSCADFKARKLPCKHMYKLAYDLGGFDLPEPL